MKRRNLGLFAAVMGLAIVVMACGSLGSASNTRLEQEIKNMQATNAALEKQLQTVQAQNPLEPSWDYPGEGEQVIVPNLLPTAESLPSEPVAAGKPVIFDGWALTLSPEVTTGTFNDEKHFRLSLTVRNLGEASRVFRYVKSGISVRDDLNNVYLFSLVNSQCKDEPDNIHLPQQITIDGTESIVIRSDPWSGCGGEKYFPPFAGVIPRQAKQLWVTIEKWGPFEGVVFYLDL